MVENGTTELSSFAFQNISEQPERIVPAPASRLHVTVVAIIFFIADLIIGKTLEHALMTRRWIPRNLYIVAYPTCISPFPSSCHKPCYLIELSQHGSGLVFALNMFSGIFSHF